VTPQGVLDFWFAETSPGQWFASDPVFDTKVRRRFGAFVRALRAEQSVAGHPWLETPDSALALILVLDQFPRNIWRGSGDAFSLDALGLEAARAMLSRGFDLKLDETRRPFAYMPFMHAESLEDQELCVLLCETRLPEDAGTARHAREHRDVIARFGRFPYRNEVLGRASTPEETAWLESGGYRPGA